VLVIHSTTTNAKSPKSSIYSCSLLSHPEEKKRRKKRRKTTNTSKLKAEAEKRKQTFGKCVAREKTQGQLLSI